MTAESRKTVGEKMVLVGAITGAHGVRGEVKVKAFTAEPAAIAAYGPLFDEGGTRRFDLTLTGKGGDLPGKAPPSKALLIGRIGGVADRNAAEALKGQRLFVPRAQLPASDDPEEFYLTDLIGLAVRDKQGADFGRVVDVANYGAGDLLMVEGAAEGSFDVPFAKAFVPEIDLAGGFLTIDLPEDFFAAPSRDGEEDGPKDGGEDVGTEGEVSGR
ncbi:ribosome maturation factor RimM [Dongia soli]|uniref:Ribosome maturation factor RimM n=1 Tax=Dongia soli TaxID=600628 RepID=A0ABU5E606_9PROT|nr:ribosome maturation factor RimM [Dongia soli]MDY0881747.1 ribosome maturation factor RimM [Dongia soli]